MPGKNAPPYRAPCSGYPRETKRRFFGHKYQNKIHADSHLPLVTNVTQVPNYTTGPATIEPYAALNPTFHPGECGGPGQPGCGPWPEPVPPNSFANFGLTQDLSFCEKQGFKIVYAYKSWHGRDGFLEQGQDCPRKILSGDTCYHQPYAGNPLTQKYLTLHASGSSAGSGTDPASPSTSATSSFSASVGRYTGNAVVTPFVDTYAAVPPSIDPDHPDPTYDAGLRLCLQMDFSCGLFSGGPDALDAYLNYGTAAYDGTTGWQGSLTVTDTTITGTVSHTVLTTGIYTFTNTYTFTITLGTPYSAASVNADLTALLAQWDLADDRVQPWRLDGHLTSGPLVTFDEFLPARPGVVNAADKSGAIRGEPMPYEYDRYFDFRAQNCKLLDPDDAGSIYVDSYGAWSPAWAPRATQWTDDIMAQYLPTGEFRAYNVLHPGYTDSRPGRIDGCLVGSKYAEIVTFSFPSHNFARPCGPKDLSTHDGRFVDCTPDGLGGYADATGPRRWKGYPCNCEEHTTREDIHGHCPHISVNPRSSVVLNPWNDNTPKGDWCLMTWWSNFRDVGEIARLLANHFIDGIPLCEAITGPPLRPISGNLYRLDMQPMCATFSACCPFKIFLTPNGEGTPPSILNPQSSACNSVTFAPPDLALDDTYGALWQRIPRQLMPDPLYVPPHKPCGLGPDDPWNEDNGTCTGDYSQTPYEECRATVPSGAPALPAGCYLGSLSIEEYNAGVPGIFLQPPPFGGPYQSPWVIAINRQLCIDGQGRFACQYSDPEALCGDPDEVEPP